MFSYVGDVIVNHHPELEWQYEKLLRGIVLLIMKRLQSGSRSWKETEQILMKMRKEDSDLAIN